DEKKNVLIETALLIPDADAAAEQISRLVKAAFQAKFGKKMIALEEKIKRFQKIHDLYEEELRNVRGHLKQTRKVLPSCRANRDLDDRDMVEVPFSHWQVRHQVEAIILLVTMLFAVLASLLTAHANLTGSGLQVFIDNPLLAWSMAALVPLSAIAVKTIHAYLHTGWAIKTFIFVLTASMLVSIGLWIILYADMYHGLSPALSVGGLLDDPSLWDQFRDTAFIVLSLTTEVLIGTCLGLRLSIIAGNYSPDYFYPNPEYQVLSNQKTTLEKKFEIHARELEDLKGDYAEYESSLALQIEILLIAHAGRRAHTPPSTL
ncbi:MAG: hypothetical protein ABJN51_19260, partial [Sneathiella sp.]